ncbi:hypothetical protein [Salibacterium salarium]|nr:hypothetical protein [Salibacterium salarium]
MFDAGTIGQVAVSLAIFGGGIVVIIAAMPDSRAEAKDILRKENGGGGE